MMLLRIAVALAGATLVITSLRSAVRTFVLPRSARDPVTRVVFVIVRFVFDMRLHWTREFATRDRVMALFAPVATLGLVVAWGLLIGVGYAGIFWALGMSVARAFVESGSSLLTLGFEKPVGWGAVLAAFYRGGYRPDAGRVTRVVSPSDVRRIRAPRVGRHAARNSRRIAAERERTARPRPRDRRLRWTREVLGGLAAMVCRVGREPHLTCRAHLFPLATAAAIVGDRGGCGARLGGAHRRGTSPWRLGAGTDDAAGRSVRAPAYCRLF